MQERKTMVISEDKKKLKAAGISVVAAFFLALLKTSAGLLFHSLGMVSAGVDSLMDLLASSINFISMRKSIKPPDPEHPYGHGKIENIASMAQAGIIGLVGLLLIGEGIRRILYVEASPDFDAGVLVMVFSGFVSYRVGSYLAKVGRETDSPLLEADSLHFRIDTFTNAGVVIGLILAQWLNQIIIDRLIAIVMGIWVMVSALRIFRSSLDALMDKYVPPEVQKEIEAIIMSHSPEIIGFHKMRTRRSGSHKLIDLHLVTCKEATLEDAHSISDHIEKEIEAKIRHSDVIIHMEPCDDKCPPNQNDCEYLRR